MIVVDVKRLDIVNLNEVWERGFVCHDLTYNMYEDKVELYSSPALKNRHKPVKTFNNVVTIEVSAYNDQKVKPDPEF